MHKGKSLKVLLLLTAMMPLYAAYPANYVKVAAIGAKVPAADKPAGMQPLVDKVITFWQKEMRRVLPDRPDLIVLPEACDLPSGISGRDTWEYLAARGEQVREAFAAIAREHRCYIAFGSYTRDGDKWYNSALLLDRTGKVAGVYHKNFPTIGEMELGITAGSEAAVFQTDFGRVGIAICFDLNFPEIRSRYEKEKPDLILFPSMYHGGLMQNFWAYSCRAYFAGAITDRATPSQIHAPTGETLAATTNYFNYALASINLDFTIVHLDYNWDKLRRLKAKYGSAVTITDPGRLGAVLVESGHARISVKDMIKEFDIEVLDDYFTRSESRRDR